MREDTNDIAVVLNVTHDASADVLHFTDKIPGIGRLLKLTVRPGVGPTSVKDANHCLQLAQASATIKRRGKRERNDAVHVFAAAPNGFMFLLGQLSQGFGPTVLYEYDFESNTLGGYKPSIRFPLAKDKDHGTA